MVVPELWRSKSKNSSMTSFSHMSGGGVLGDFPASVGTGGVVDD